jgi:hypothetical protein
MPQAVCETSTSLIALPTPVVRRSGHKEIYLPPPICFGSTMAVGFRDGAGAI